MSTQLLIIPEEKLLTLLENAYKEGFNTYELAEAGLEPYDPITYALYIIFKLKKTQNEKTTN
jgi:hypothetical protein